MPVVEPVVTEEKLRLLLDEQHESAGLDYKATCDLSQTQDLVEVTKDVGAMQIDGGFLVIGADDRGNPTGQLSPTHAALFDEARLRGKLARYLPAPFEVRSAVHEVGGSLLAVVHIAPNAKGFCIFKQDGVYTDDKGKTAIIFRKGDVFARHRAYPVRSPCERLGWLKSTPLKSRTVSLNQTSKGSVDAANLLFASATFSPSISTMPMSPCGV